MRHLLIVRLLGTMWLPPRGPHVSPLHKQKVLLGFWFTSGQTRANPSRCRMRCGKRLSVRTAPQQHKAYCGTKQCRMWLRVLAPVALVVQLKGAVVGTTLYL